MNAWYGITIQQMLNIISEYLLIFCYHESMLWGLDYSNTNRLYEYCLVWVLLSCSVIDEAQYVLKKNVEVNWEEITVVEHRPFA